jgi:hypothetical protein
MPLFSPADDILAAMITPAVLISASGTLSLSTSNRLGRVVDRVRELGAAAEELPPVEDKASAAEVEEKRDLIARQLEKLSARVVLLQRALTAVYLAIGLLVAASLSVGVVAAVGWSGGWGPAVLGLAGASALLYASGLLVREARLAVETTLHEMGYVRRVVARKTGRPLGGTG